ncbi:hypothetical protein IB277_12630 [Ensifer sp. ENS07]|jgi:uncharacterized membrane protein YuzA (DUF378 family)|uniref:DUF3329 domain-containing protein n=1 Tax=Ensifer adhaerens TaxID=106592 RepID=A0A9Q8Y643_ENSAD|nr:MULTISPECIES: hypothetical protein [Ensifer]MBD9593737.1 hypothetical protein [Ensifer sp. ENS05]MBD9637150.1 hypothetical protein [Ensifer sp. ENS07]MCY1743416.1 hypothetical protein [Ensifer sp. SL37]USJ22220.1 hypothetical protein NE863_12960 [Ensifer adhaerens]UTV35535.1 hypothetical protein MYG64_13350 [Ensifer adhaerens]
MLKFIDPDHPFYRPLWIRLLIVGFCGVWTVVEFLGEQAMWGMIFLAVTAYASAALLVFYKPSEKGVEKAGDEGQGKGDGSDAAG